MGLYKMTEQKGLIDKQGHRSVFPKLLWCKIDDVIIILSVYICAYNFGIKQELLSAKKLREEKMRIFFCFHSAVCKLCRTVTFLFPTFLGQKMLLSPISEI